ncbi:hypothetical protein G6F62_008623 [Rhizopus arrhizus]|nr:hypothetical protein G6F62_008623 [Rhizopus arrhizus]
MVLSNSQPFLPAAEFYTAPKSKAILKPRSYAQVVSAKQRVSLMHKDINEPDQDSDSPLKELQSRVYRASRSPNAFMLDITQVKSEYTDLQCMQELKAQHPNVYACTILRDESTQYLELYLEKEKDNNDILETGVVFNKLKLRIMPCRAVDDTGISSRRSKEEPSSFWSPCGCRYKYGNYNRFFHGSRICGSRGP